MEVKQIFTLLNDVSKQVFGSQAITVTDITGFVSLGTSVLGSETTRDNYLNTLIDRIGKTVVRARKYTGTAPDLMRNAFEFGAVLQKIDVKIPEASINNEWNIGSGGHSDPFVITKPQVTQKLFSGINTWNVDVTIPDKMFRTAFTSPSEMAVFIDGIFMAIDNSIAIKVDTTTMLAIDNFIAEKINANNGVVNLLKLWNDTHTANKLTSVTALDSSDFLRFAGNVIQNYITRLHKPTTIFNNEGRVRWTPDEDMSTLILADFIHAYTRYMQADAFHNYLVELPRYYEVAYWQGIGNNTFSDVSKIDLVSSSGASVSKSGIIAVIHDVEAIGTTIDRYETSTERNNRDRYTNYFNSAEIGYFNDLSENGIIFTIEDEVNKK